MLASAFMMLVGSAFLMLRMGNSTGSFPKPLTAEEEKKYLELWQKGDEEARNVLIEHNLRLVAHIVKKYYTPSADVDDLISIGTIGLIKGVSSYKPDKGVRLATYASRCIENAILPQTRRRGAAEKKNGAQASIGLCARSLFCRFNNRVQQSQLLPGSAAELLQAAIDHVRVDAGKAIRQLPPPFFGFGSIHDYLNRRAFPADAAHPLP